VIVETGKRQRRTQLEGLEQLADAGALLAGPEPIGEGLETLVAAVAAATGSEVVVARVVDDTGGFLLARAVAPASSALAAEIEGSRVAVDEVEDGEVSEPERLPPAVRRLAVRVRAASSLQLPATAGDRLVGTLELMRGSGSFSDTERAVARFAAGQLALAVLGRAPRGDVRAAAGTSTLTASGDTLAAGADGSRTAAHVLDLAAKATGAAAGVLWRGGAGETLEPLVSVGPIDAWLDAASAIAVRALGEWRPAAVEEVAGVPEALARAATLQLGQPAFGVLQLFYPADSAPTESDVALLAGFCARAAHALRASENTRRLSLELDRSRALLEVVGEAISRLSLAHTLETAVDRIAELLGIDRIAVYLREGKDLVAAAGRSLPDRHDDVADILLDLALGPFRARTMLLVQGGDTEPALAPARAALAAAGLTSALAVPLRVRAEPIGLLAAYPTAERELTENEVALLSSLAVQLAVVVQNARLHEQAKELGDALGGALASERQAAKRLGALYEISRSFAQSLSLGTTLDAVTRTVVELLDVDAAVIRIPDGRRELLEPRAVHVADVRLADAVRTILAQPQRLALNPIQRLFRTGESLILTASVAQTLGGSHALLVPFLEKGSTAALLPIATPAEVLASLTIVSLDPARPIDGETMEAALSIAAQAALAIDNARLYQHQKDFTDTMQRSLLPDRVPEIPGLELGAVYESAATVDVGGDVYDFLQLPDGRLAVVLGDVTGHGIEATADMAMAKFVFRSLAREHQEPGDFLAHANEVIVGEIALGKFITMAYLTIDPGTGAASCAAAGHPAPRIVRASGVVEALAPGGLALGIDSGQVYEAVAATLEPGDAVVLYTDGVIEARRERERELYGVDRLDEAIARGHELPAKELAELVVSDCRAFGDGELDDDVAVVVIRRTAS
jgi:serine phosphatase RsbU (regulator of sigma subunit)